MTRLAILSLILVSLGISSYPQINDQFIRMKAIEDFPILIREGNASNRKPYGPYHIEADLDALAGDDLNFTFHMAAAEGVFPGKAGRYTVNLNTITERDGECVYNVYVNNAEIGLFQQNPPTNEFTAPAMLQWAGVEIPEKARIRVESNNWSNLKRHEDNFYEYARGRWTSVDFIPEEENYTPSRENTSFGIFETFENTGPSGHNAQVSYNITEQAYYLADMPEDPTHAGESYGLLWRSVNGDYSLEALVTHIAFGRNGDRKAGLLVRQSDKTGAPYVACVLEGDGLVALEYRNEYGSPIKKVSFTNTGAEMIQLEKKGNTFTMSAAVFGEDYERHSIELAGFNYPQQIGLFISSADVQKQSIVRFSAVRFFVDKR